MEFKKLDDLLDQSDIAFEDESQQEVEKLFAKYILQSPSQDSIGLGENAKTQKCLAPTH